jgi:hypothetical protein
MQRQLIVALLIVCGGAVAANPAQSVFLEALSKQLRVDRSQPPGATLKMRCPDSMQPLIGLSERAVQSVLGKPDYDMPLPDLTYGDNRIVSVDRHIWIYFVRAQDVKNPPAFSLGGGGIWGLWFFFDNKSRVTHAECRLP